MPTMRALLAVEVGRRAFRTFDSMINPHMRALILLMAYVQVRVSVSHSLRINVSSKGDISENLISHSSSAMPLDFHRLLIRTTRSLGSLSVPGGARGSARAYSVYMDVRLQAAALVEDFLVVAVRSHPVSVIKLCVRERSVHLPNGIPRDSTYQLVVKQAVDANPLPMAHASAQSLTVVESLQEACYDTGDDGAVEDDIPLVLLLHCEL